ncbi:GNAT family N-acetyltransferase [Consotaella salsifontis]|uniref:Ribosomal-protein-alanine N-acetyltransferase n=1 Tax=Consotaella salsifontis TaxID=1365950 RepID=A0A1T4MWJ8_9HYPH|nr:GNAT family protein [Consotaella salsifontis]SJZ71291.1 ribosomal-protein-alanine N-acetyltransferase [Consotaella salsifontis]
MSVFDSLFHPVFPKVDADGILLRMPQAGDYIAWRDLRSRSRAFLTPWEPMWGPDELSRRSYQLRIQRYRQDARERTGYTFFLFDEPGRTLYGGATIGLIRRGVSQSCTLGYWMGEPYAGIGLMSRAVEALKHFVFDVEGLHRIEAACLPSNERSIRLLERAGFRREGYARHYLKIAGRWEDHYLYALLADEHVPRKGRKPLLAANLASAAS